MVRGDRLIGIRVRYPEAYRSSTDRLGSLLVTSPTLGQTVRSSTHAEVEEGQTESAGRTWQSGRRHRPAEGAARLGHGGIRPAPKGGDPAGTEIAFGASRVQRIFRLQSAAPVRPSHLRDPV
jgi:hypothetical protein